MQKLLKIDRLRSLESEGKIFCVRYKITAGSAFRLHIIKHALIDFALTFRKRKVGKPVKSLLQISKA
jgi:hypothetical protein